MFNIKINSFYIISISIIYTIYTIILIKVKWIASKRAKLQGQEKDINPYTKKDSMILASLIIIELLFLILYIFKIDFIICLNAEIPNILRIIALIIGFFGLFIIGWASFTLDGEFSETIELKQGHRLVQQGPYKYIRHPIYLGFILLHIGVTIALANFLIFFVYNGGLFLLLLERIPREEKVLHAYFGKSWEEYCCKTNRFIPYKIVFNNKNRACKP